MSRIKDLYAEVEGIDDLKPVENRDFFDKVAEKRVVDQILDNAKQERRQVVEDWLYERAEFEWGQDDEGHAELYFENFEEVCEEAATDLMDEYIECQHLDITDEQYTHIIEMVRDNLANMWADIECDCIQRSIQDEKDAQELRDDFYNDRNLGIKK